MPAKSVTYNSQNHAGTLGSGLVELQIDFNLPNFLQSLFAKLFTTKVFDYTIVSKLNFVTPDLVARHALQ